MPPPTPPATREGEAELFPQTPRGVASS